MSFIIALKTILKWISIYCVHMYVILKITGPNHEKKKNLCSSNLEESYFFYLPSIWLSRYQFKLNMLLNEEISTWNVSGMHLKLFIFACKPLNLQCCHLWISDQNQNQSRSLAMTKTDHIVHSYAAIKG